MRKLLVVAVLGLAVAGCGSGSNGTPSAEPGVVVPTTPTSVPKGNWKVPASNHYRFDFRPSCYCDTTPLRIEVRDAKVVKATLLERRGEAGPERYTPTIELLVADAQRAKVDATGEVDVEFDANGIPVKAAIDWQKNGVDDEVAWRIENYEVLG